jgi:entericidin B
MHILKMILAMMVAVTVLSACNTVKGAGKDIEHGGEILQDSAE